MLTTSIRNVKKGYIEGPYGKLHYWTIGQGDALFLIHQSSSNSEEYAGLIPYLSNDYQLISFDWPGHGNSDDPSFEFGVEEYTECAFAVLDALEIQTCHVLGHHGGALLTMNMAYLQPKRVLKIILSGTSGPKTAAESEAFKKSLPIKRHHEIAKDGQAILDTWKRFVNYMPNTEGARVMLPFLANQQSKLRPYDAHYGVLGWDRNPALHSLQMPVLIIKGENDDFVSRQEKLLEIIPNSKRKMVPNVGAFMFQEDPEAVAKVIARYLRD